MRKITNLNQLLPHEASNIAFVPTMGALHAGHSKLIERARQCSSNVLVSVFINPLQFGDPKDLEKYPRSPAADAAVAEKSGAAVLWRPEFKEIYPDYPGQVESISAGPLGERFEGASRKGHFDGMLTVVNRLFNLIAPQWAIFGEKDFQQLFLVRQMVLQQSKQIEIISVPTVRDGDGLAISSRNVRLSDEDRVAARVISKALINASSAKSLTQMQEQLDNTLAQEPRFTRDYSAIIDEENFDLASEQSTAKRALVAGWVSGVRLIDNMAMRNHSR
ncbi:MAG: pantoate--beta-alanine ligase [Candidatus Nanopelagicaceae bacterium]|nr:pantoate--beta-alanine ligase [Candidatus Nanopelagicaceae bacterium]